jgi:hypothetical protein
VLDQGVADKRKTLAPWRLCVTPLSPNPKKSHVFLGLSAQSAQSAVDFSFSVFQFFSRGRRLTSDTMRLAICSHQVANHSLVAGVPPARFAFEEGKRIIIQGNRHLGLSDRPTRKLIDRRQLVSDAMEVTNDFPLVV